MRNVPFPSPRGEGQGEGPPRATIRKTMSTPKRTTSLARILRKKSTGAEKVMWSWLRDRRFSADKFRRQHSFGNYILDFYCLEASLNIELDGSGHGFPGQQSDDSERDAWLEARGVKVLRFWNNQLKDEKDSVRDKIWDPLQERAPKPLPDYCRPMNPAADDENGGQS